MIQRIVRALTAVGFAASISVAAAPLAAADATISTEGPNSGISTSSTNSTTVTNNNNVSVTNSNYQKASSGDATVSNNTTGGSATSGNATNNNETSTSVSISNIAMLPGGDMGDFELSTEGPNSPIHASRYNSSSVTNNNNVYVSNRNYQKASTGDAKVSHNTTGGSATSGNATNNNSTRTSVSINNGGHGGGSGGGNNQGGNPSTSTGGSSGGAQVLGTSLSVASIAGGSGGVGQLPLTGLNEGLSPWVAVTILTLLSSAIYWRFAIVPKLKA